jgi:hypothetical protein
VPEARDWPRPVPRTFQLRNRTDLCQHFTISALLSASAGLPVADAVGLYKELSDSRRRSGFSFTDLAADRAGAMFGLVATRSAESARRLQSRVAAGVVEDDIMPDIEGLPDGLSDAELTARFGGVGGAAYNELVQEIARRVSSLALFQ